MSNLINYSYVNDFCGHYCYSSYGIATVTTGLIQFSPLSTQQTRGNYQVL